MGRGLPHGRDEPQDVHQVLDGRVRLHIHDALVRPGREKGPDLDRQAVAGATVDVLEALDVGIDELLAQRTAGPAQTRTDRNNAKGGA